MLQQAVNILKEGKIEEAKNLFRKILESQPKNIEANHYLGISLQLLGKLNEAEKSFRKVIELKPDYGYAYQNLGNTLIQLLKFDEAELIYKKAQELNPNDVIINYNLGNTLRNLNKFEQAEENYIKAIELKPDFAEAYNALGNLYIDLGKFEQAEENYIKAIELKPDFTNSYHKLSIIKNFSKENEFFFKMQNLYHKKKLDDKKRSHICFALGKIYEDLNQFEQSFKYYAEGNKLKKNSLNYNAYQDIEVFDQLKKSYPKIKKNSLKIFNETFNPQVIFILGMPRSGTTLVEQIISSHSKVKGAGELKYVSIFGDNIARGISQITTETLTNFRKNYLNKMQELSNGSSFITDKTTLNFKYIGLVCSTIPGVKIINVERNIAATCWGCYKQYFSDNNLPFSYSLEDIINFYKLYQNLMKFWKDEYGSQIYHLNYEELTINQESEIRKLIEYLELNWEKECLFPQNNKKIVRTASAFQARKKIYQNSSHDWKNFEPYLKGIFDNINDI